MVNVDEIRGLMAKKHISQTKMAKIIGISAKTFYLKMKARKFNSDEMKILNDVLDIENPQDIFFAD